MDIFLAAAIGHTEQIDTRLNEDPSWINATFSRVRPSPEKEWANDWATPLWYAAMNGQIDTVEYLIEKGADPSIQDATGQSIAEHPAQAGHSEIADRLNALQSADE